VPAPAGARQQAATRAASSVAGWAAASHSRRPSRGMAPPARLGQGVGQGREVAPAPGLGSRRQGSTTRGRSCSRLLHVVVQPVMGSMPG
jgi:hypothetical protein